MGIGKSFLLAKPRGERGREAKIDRRKERTREGTHEGGERLRGREPESQREIIREKMTDRSKERWVQKERYKYGQKRS